MSRARENAGRSHEDAPDLSAAMSVVAGRELLRRVVTILAPTPVVALKGVVISALMEGTGEQPRRMVDVDVLIPVNDRDEAERRLCAAGLVELSRDSCATTFRPSDLPVDLDVHVRLAQPGLFALDEAAVIERASLALTIPTFGPLTASSRDLALPAVERPRETTMSSEARIPDRHDLYAHLVAHFVRNRSSAKDLRRLNDLAVVARQLPMDSKRLAAHLQSVGLSRAARYVLQLAAPQDPFAAAVLADLPADLVGDALAHVATRWLEVRAGNAKLAIPAAHLLNYSLAAGIRSLASHVVEGALRGFHLRP